MDWTCDVVARMHRIRLTNAKLAEATGYSYQYISMILRGHRDTESAREKILAALAEAEANAGQNEKGGIVCQS